MFRMQRTSSDRLSILQITQPIRVFAHYGGPSTSKRTYYEILGVSSKASQAEIKEAFFALSKKFHPDMNKDNKDAHDRFVEINEAYEVLSKPDSRFAYDAKLQQPQSRSYQDPGDPTGPWTNQQPPDSVDELYRRYFGELYRRRYTGGSRKSYEGQRQESPFRDRYRDPPIWERYDSAGQRVDPFAKWQRPNPPKSFPMIGIRILIRWYITLVLAALLLQLVMESMGLVPPPPPSPYESTPPSPDSRSDDRWWISVATDSHTKPKPTVVPVHHNDQDHDKPGDVK